LPGKIIEYNNTLAVVLSILSIPISYFIIGSIIGWIVDKLKPQK